MTAVNIHQAKTNLSRLIAEVEAGGDVTISRGAVPVAKLVAISQHQNRDSTTTRTSGLFSHLGPLPDSFFETLPEAELASWEGAFDGNATRIATGL
jgi:prevent-host-death family protein